ncbi:MAG: hypothetical protein EA341_06845 [Mongoliibacter sp.]|uniref:hypothetical protein n=1 Tax=Mongoliibacter sp. TaxID=2022438 RepID=UPI0012F08089|nr:hypothetical protein [Mongoliibacter sp.]TVP50636.1 MAG: hypothetical protein EA341_06845 [Mongoliibacter sp.]
MIKKLGFIILFFFSLSGQLSAQDQDSVQTASVESIGYDFVIINSRFQNAFTFMGRDFGLDIPIISTDLMYYFRSGVYVNLSALKFMEENLPWQYALSLGYATDLSETTDINISYSQFLVAGESAIAGIQNLAFLQGSFGWEWGPLYSSFQAQTLFNESIDYFFTSHHSRYFEIDQRLFKSVVVSFEPKLSLMAGTNNFYQMGNFEMLPEEQDDLGKFGLQSFEFMLPLTFTKGLFELEFQYRFVNPFSVPLFDPSRPRSLFLGQASYSIPVKKNIRKKR